MQTKSDWGMWIIGAVIALVLCIFTYMIMTAAKAYGQPEPVKEARQWPPAIEQCDLPTWDRVIMKCP